MEKPSFQKEEREIESSKYNVNYRFKEAIETLKDVFGVENLSNIELFHLRKITEDTLKRAERDNASSDLATINPLEEIPVRFLYELYGIDYFHMKINAKSDKDIEGFNEYIRRMRERAHLI